MLKVVRITYGASAMGGAPRFVKGDRYLHERREYFIQEIDRIYDESGAVHYELTLSEIQLAGFRFRMASIVDIRTIARRTTPAQISGQYSPVDEPDTPCIVFQNGIEG